MSHGFRKLCADVAEILFFGVVLYGLLAGAFHLAYVVHLTSTHLHGAMSHETR
jgi:hypothetical protein